MRTILLVKKYQELKDSPIKFKKPRKFLEDAQYYIEDVRKLLLKKLIYENNINTPINLKLQK